MNIIKNYKLWFALTGTVILVGLILFIINGFNLGIDFVGGTMIQIDFGKEIPVDELQQVITPLNLEAQIQHAGDSNREAIMRTPKNLSNEERMDIFSRYQEKYALETNDLLASEQFSPSIGREIMQQAIIAICIASVLMLIYISLRFETIFGVGAIISLIHDILFLLAIYVIFRLPVNSTVIAAVLTVVGYSINDTIVIFDRIREDAKRSHTKNYFEIAGNAVQKTLRRTMITSVTTLVMVISLYIFGAQSIKNFALPLLVGIAVGTYSSIFIASTSWALIRQKMANGKRYHAK